MSWLAASLLLAGCASFLSAQVPDSGGVSYRGSSASSMHVRGAASITEIVEPLDRDLDEVNEVGQHPVVGISHQRAHMTNASVNLYDNVYGDFASTAEALVRRETYGEDMGQSSWLTAPEWMRFADQLAIGADSDVLEVGSGSGGPAVYLALARGCRLTGVDINEHGVRNATELAASRGVSDRVQFRATDGGQPLPFSEDHFDAVVSNDAMCHIRARANVLGEWYRVLRPGGRALFTDAMVLTGIVSHDELATRSSIGFYLFVPPGENERLLTAAGFTVVGVEDVTQSAADVARRWHDARARQQDALVAREGPANFEGLQRFLMCVHALSMERRLSRYAYLAEKPSARESSACSR